MALFNPTPNDCDKWEGFRRMGGATKVEGERQPLDGLQIRTRSRDRFFGTDANYLDHVEEAGVHTDTTGGCHGAVPKDQIDFTSSASSLVLSEVTVWLARLKLVISKGQQARR